jgi:hypothetical protein
VDDGEEDQVGGVEDDVDGDEEAKNETRSFTREDQMSAAGAPTGAEGPLCNGRGSQGRTTTMHGKTTSISAMSLRRRRGRG